MDWECVCIICLVIIFLTCFRRSNLRFLFLFLFRCEILRRVWKVVQVPNLSLALGLIRWRSVSTLRVLVAEGCGGTDGCVTCILPIVRLVEGSHSVFILHVVFGINTREVVIARLLIAIRGTHDGERTYFLWGRGLALDERGSDRVHNGVEYPCEHVELNIFGVVAEPLDLMSHDDSSCHDCLAVDDVDVEMLCCI